MDPVLLTQKEYKQLIVESLIKEEANLYQEYLDSIKTKDKQIYKELMDNPRKNMFSQLSDTIFGDIPESKIKEMARRIAIEQSDSINIGDVLYNINIGRGIFIDFILRMD